MFGDQNLFCRKSDLMSQGGYDESIPIMEDLELLMRLHYAGRLHQPDSHAPDTLNQGILDHN